MFNAWRFNGATFAGSAGGVRVLFAASTFAALAAVSAAAGADRPGASALDGWAGVEPTVTTYREGSAHGHVLATFEPGRPWDLVGADLAGLTGAEADGFRIGAGVAYLDATAALEPSEVVYNTTAMLEVSASAVADGYTIADGAASFGIEADLYADPWRIRHARSDGLAPAGFTAEAFAYRGGFNYFDGRTDADAYSVVNGVHESYPEITAHASMSVDGTREARSPVEADVRGHFLPSPVPWLGSQVEGAVTAGMFATWWAYRQFQLTLPRDEVVTATNAPWGFNTAVFGGSSQQVFTRVRAASMDATGHRRAAGAVLMDARAEAAPVWSRWVEPSLVFAESISFADLAPWRIRPETADHRALGDLEAVAWKVSFRESAFDARAAVEPRAFVNFTNDAPDWRSMTVPAERRAMVVPYENRMMVVR